MYIFNSIQLNPGPEIAVNNVSRVSTSFTSLVFTSAAVGFSPYLIWHNRLGHPNHEALKTILQLYNIYVPHKYVLDFCNSCCLGKIHILPSISSHIIYTNPFDILFVDVWGHAHVLYSCGYKYLLTCVNACSKYTWVFPLKLKSDVIVTPTHFITSVKVQFSTKIKVNQTDRGGKFRSLKSLLHTKGISHRLAFPQTHRQNGSVERKHRYMVETSLILLAQANIPLKF